MEPLDPGFAKLVVGLASVVLVVIRAPHGNRSRGVPVAKDRKGGLEKALLTLAWVSFFLPLVWVFSSWPDAANYPLDPFVFAAGVAVYARGLWLFHRSHADLGTNWSISLEVRERHTLVTGGVYASVRHPMYLALFCHAAGQAVVLPNWIAGPSYLVVMLILVACRLGPEERMMREEFGAEWDAYAARTKRLIPGVW